MRPGSASSVPRSCTPWAWRRSGRPLRRTSTTSTSAGNPRTQPACCAVRAGGCPGSPRPRATPPRSAPRWDFEDGEAMILVTGASGHLGANLVRRLLDDGHEVRVLLRGGSDNRAMAGLDVALAYGDLRDHAALKL